MKIAFEAERRAETDGKLAKMEERIYGIGKFAPDSGYR